VNPILYQGARPVFIDSERQSWNIDPQALSEALTAKAKVNRLPRAVIVVHLYGQSADMAPILEVCQRYEVPVLEDAAEAVGTLYQGRPAGAWGALAAYSFNGNKIITTTGGGMLSSPNAEWISKARYWSTQAREPGLAYQHVDVGYNYRLSNVLAAIGRGQLRVLDDRVKQRRSIAERYQKAFTGVQGLTFAPDAGHGLHTRWLSCLLVDEKHFGTHRDGLIRVLDAANIECRPVWKPMHLQPLFSGTEFFGAGVSGDLFARGVCLPSSSSLREDEVDYIAAAVVSAGGRGAG
jgi:pyridoxal phosphate-dependent aminotransferase EpsN